jgi:hypothetical protein
MTAVGSRIRASVKKALEQHQADIKKATEEREKTDALDRTLSEGLGQALEDSKEIDVIGKG